MRVPVIAAALLAASPAFAMLADVVAICDGGMLKEYALRTDSEGRNEIFWNGVVNVGGGATYVSTVRFEDAALALLPDGSIEVIGPKGRRLPFGKVDMEKVAELVACGAPAAPGFLVAQAPEGTWAYERFRARPVSPCRYNFDLLGAGSKGWWRDFRRSFELVHAASGERFRIAESYSYPARFKSYWACLKSGFGK